MDSAQLLIIHSYFRWLVLIVMIIQFIWVAYQYKRKTVFSNNDFKYLVLFTLIINIQLIIGWSLYLNSMLVDTFWQNPTLGLKNRQLRFFGLEHMSMMSLGIILLNINTYKAYHTKDKTTVFRKLFRAYIWVYLIILSSIPWSFSPLTSRPDFR